MIARERVDGVLLLDKPSGLSSNVALQRARRLLNAAKAGHTGTLDPLATGLLPLCFGEATKFAQVLLDSRKEYLATVQFGAATTTGDAEGEIVARAPVAFSISDLERALASFLGVSQQVPPRYAALKYQGRAYYEYARAGAEVPRPARAIHVDALELRDHAQDRAVLRIGCSKGTYVRTLVEDVALTLGSAGHLVALRRIAAGPFRIEGSHPLDELEASDIAARHAMLLPIDAPVADLPRVKLSAQQATDLVHGKTVAMAADPTGRVRAYDSFGAFLGLGMIEGQALRALRLVDTSTRRERGSLPVES